MHNIAFSSGYKDVRDVVMNGKKTWFSFYSRRPQCLFSGKAGVRNSVFISSYGAKQETDTCHTTRLHRWQARERDALFSLISYAPASKTRVVPMLNDAQEGKIFKPAEKFLIGDIFVPNSKHKLCFKQTAYNYISVSPNPPPYFDPHGNPIDQGNLFSIAISEKKYRDVCLLLFGGKLFFCHWLIYGDEFNFTKSTVRSFPLNVRSISSSDMLQLLALSDQFSQSLESTIQYKRNAGKKVGSYNTSKLWPITDQSDLIFLNYMAEDPESAFQCIENHVQSTLTAGEK